MGNAKTPVGGAQEQPTKSKAELWKDEFFKQLTKRGSAAKVKEDAANIYLWALRSLEERALLMYAINGGYYPTDGVWEFAGQSGLYFEFNHCDLAQSRVVVLDLGKAAA